MTLFDAGDEGFLNLLRDLGPYLATPLVVQAVTMDRHEFVDAKEWIVRPGAKEVETKTIDKLSDDTDDAGFLDYEEFTESVERESAGMR
jgi:hypothetical protein